MILLGLGSNLGDREGNISAAIQHLNESCEIRVASVSSLYETEPVGFLEQPAFLNAVISLQTKVSPFDLLEKCLLIEKSMGRIRDKRWGPRVIDIDILIYHHLRLNSECLQIPHPRIPERRFVLVPIEEIAPYELIWGEKTARELLENSKDTSQVKMYGSIRSCCNEKDRER